MPEGTETDRPIPIAPAAHVAGDETSRYLEWAKDRSAWEMPVGTPVYYSALASAPATCDHQFHFFGDQRERRCNRCGVIESKASAPVADERAAFEASYRSRFNVPAHAGLTFPDVAEAWKWWQRRAALASAPVAGDKFTHNDDCARYLASAPVAGEAKISEDDALGILSEHGDHNVEHGRIMFDKWTLRAAGVDLMQRCRNAASPANNQGWSGWACQYPGKLPRLYGARELAELNCDPGNGDRMLLLSENAAPQDSEADPLQGAADWLMRAFEPPFSASDLARQLVIGYNRATRLRDAALSAQPGAQASEAKKPTSD